MIGSLVANDADTGDVEKYFRALRRAQRALDVEPERYTHYFLRELPEPYTREVFERTHRWMEELDLFSEESRGKGGYRESVLTAVAAE